MNYTDNSRKSSFPDPLVSTEVKKSKAYGLQYAKAMEAQWGKNDIALFFVRKKEFYF